MSDDFRAFLAGFIQTGAFFAFIGACIGDIFRKRMYMGALLGFLLWPIGWLMVLCLEDRRFKCPECLAASDPKARRCRHCGANLAPPKTVKCPCCSAKIPVDGLPDGENACPACGNHFILQ